jgi:uncharacterized protein YcfL
MKALISIISTLMLVGCTQTVTMIHTEGQADDIVDDTSSVSPNIAPEITVPISGV